LYELKKLEEVSGTPQTQLTLTFQVNVGGRMPARLVSSKGKGVDQLSYLSVMRRHFDKSFEIDEAVRVRNEVIIANHATAYTSEENDIVNEGLSYFKLFEDVRAKKGNASVLLKEGDKNAWGYSSSTVRARPQDVLAHAWNLEKRCFRRKDYLESSTDETSSDHNKLVYVRKSMKKPFDDREFLTRFVWKETEDGTFVLVSRAEESHKRPMLNGVIRGKLPGIMKFKGISATETKIEYVLHPIPGGTLPKFITKLLMKSYLKRVTEIQMLFEGKRTLAQWDAEDGKLVGDAMASTSKREKARSLTKGKRQGHSLSGVKYRIQRRFSQYRGLREIVKKYAFFEAMMARVLQNKLRTIKSVRTKLHNVSIKEGETIGSGLAASLVSALTAEAAVDEWIRNYPPLAELDREEVWFRPMLDTVALRLLKEVPWGLQLRVYVGAGLSMLDMVSDIYVVVLYSKTPGQEGYGMSLLWMIFVCMITQLMVVYIQNKSKPKKFLMEALVVLTGLKPGKQTLLVCCIVAV
jgi:hypothetical protein